jgi:hypothetical protein
MGINIRASAYLMLFSAEPLPSSDSGIFFHLLLPSVQLYEVCGGNSFFMSHNVVVILMWVSTETERSNVNADDIMQTKNT